MQCCCDLYSAARASKVSGDELLGCAGTRDNGNDGRCWVRSQLRTIGMRSEMIYGEARYAVDLTIVEIVVLPIMPGTFFVEVSINGI
jgi:hypothetical protein